MRRHPRRLALLNWAALRIERHGVPFVIGIPFSAQRPGVGGLAAGVVRYPVRRYAIGAGVAEAVWASYSVGVGYSAAGRPSNDFYALTWRQHFDRGRRARHPGPVDLPHPGAAAVARPWRTRPAPR